MNFDQIAKNLLKTPNPKSESNPLERASALIELAEAGFGRKDIFSEMRMLYDNAEDDMLKKQLLDMVIKVHGLYKDEEKKDTPNIIFNVTGSAPRFQDMICPPAAPIVLMEAVN